MRCGEPPEHLLPGNRPGVPACPCDGASLGDDREALLRVARYSARAPIAEPRLRYDLERAEVEVEVFRDPPAVGAP